MNPPGDDLIRLQNEITKLRKERDRQSKGKNGEIASLRSQVKALTLTVERLTPTASTASTTVPGVTSPYTNIPHDRRPPAPGTPLEGPDACYALTPQGARNGLDMTRVRTFGDEDISYITDPGTKPLATLLKLVYLHPEHPENRVISHIYLNLEWIIFKHPDHTLHLHLEYDREMVTVLMQKVCENMTKLFGLTFDSVEERQDATNQLLAAMDKEVTQLVDRFGNKTAYEMLPVWNHHQFEALEERRWYKYAEFDPHRDKR